MKGLIEIHFDSITHLVRGSVGQFVYRFVVLGVVGLWVGGSVGKWVCGFLGLCVGGSLCLWVFNQSSVCIIDYVGIEGCAMPGYI